MPTKTKQSEAQKIPKLRFAGFCGGWEDKKLGEIAEITSSKRVYLSDYVNTGIPFFRGKEISELKRSKTVTDVLYIKKSKFLELKNKFGAPQKDDILITSVGTLGNIYRVNLDYEFYFKDGNLIWFKNPATDSSFLEMILDHHCNDLLKGVIGSTQKALTIVGIKKVKIPFPFLPEQQKIAKFLTAVDGWIENLREQKESLGAYKKGMMQRIFSRKIRFPGFSGEWEEKKLGDCLDYEQPTNYIVESTEYSNKYKIPVLTAGKTFILGYTNEEKGIFDTNKLPVIIFDDFTTTSQFVDFSFKVKSSAMKILKAKKDSDIKFIYEIMQLINYKIGGHGRHWISKYANIKISVPSLPEQQKIADFLTSIDNLINSKQQRITKAEKWKKGLMQGLFV